MSKKKFSAFSHVFDESTFQALFKLSSQGYFDTIESPVSIGKESNVFTVLHGDERRVVKIYRTAANFKKMYDYMRPDRRFSNIKGTKLHIIYTWAKKEFRNLFRAHEHDVAAPTPYAVYKNVLVMEYFPAQILLYAPPKHPKQFYEKLIKELRKLREAGLVHGDVSEYNILNYKEKPVLIDFSHAIDLRYPNVDQLLRRDMGNCVRYFRKQGLSLDIDKEFQRIWTNKN